MSHDSKCADLARYFLESSVPTDVLESMIWDLAEALQQTVEDFAVDASAVWHKREILKRRRDLGIASSGYGRLTK